MKNKFFELIMEELENNKNYQKSSILKMSLLLYIASVSKVVGEELENLRDDNYLFLEYLNNLGFEYNFQSSYLENIENFETEREVIEKGLEDYYNKIDKERREPPVIDLKNLFDRFH